MDDELSFSDWLSNQMRRHGWTQADVAREAKIGRSAIHNILNNKTQQPSSATCIAIANALKIAPETVFRAANLLPPSYDIKELDDFKSVLAKMPPMKRQIVLAIVRLIAEL